MDWHNIRGLWRYCWWYGCAVIYLWFFLATALHAYYHPLLNWDMIAYMGVAESFTTSDPDKLHDATMADMKEVDDAGTFYHHHDKDPLINTAESFRQQLPFFSIKPLYTGAVWLLHALGIAMSKATWMLSILGFLGVGAICYYVFPSGSDPGLWWLVVCFFCGCGHYPLAAVAHLSTPDTLCLAFSIAAYCLWMYQRSFFDFAGCFLMAQLSRPDTLMLSAMLTLFFTFIAPAPYRFTLRHGLGFIFIAILSYVVITAVTGTYGWKALFYYYFITRSARPADVVPDFSVQQYVHIVYDGILHITANACLQLLCLGTVIASCCYHSENRHMLGVLWATWLAFALRFVVFPAGQEDRYYYPYYLIMLYAMWEAATPHVQYCAARAWRYVQECAGTSVVLD
jgi:hypothetical protein